MNEVTQPFPGKKKKTRHMAETSGKFAVPHLLLQNCTKLAQVQEFKVINDSTTEDDPDILTQEMFTMLNRKWSFTEGAGEFLKVVST